MSLRDTSAVPGAAYPWGRVPTGHGDPTRPERGPHHRKSEARHSHTRDLSAEVKLLPLTHEDVGFLFRKLLCWPMRQRSPCGGGGEGQGFVSLHRWRPRAPGGEGVRPGSLPSGPQAFTEHRCVPAPSGPARSQGSWKRGPRDVHPVRELRGATASRAGVDTQ